MPKKQPGIGKIPGVKVNNSLRQGGADLFVEELEHFPEQFLTIGNRHQLGFDVQQRSGVILRNNFTDSLPGGHGSPLIVPDPWS